MKRQKSEPDSRPEDREGCGGLLFWFVAAFVIIVIGMATCHEVQYHGADEPAIDTTLQDHSKIPDSL